MNKPFKAVAPNLLLWSALVWLASPAFTAVNIEAYSARMQSIAFLMASSRPFDYDPMMPLHADYLYLTRNGVIYLLALYYRIFGPVPDVGFRAIVAASFCFLVLFSAIFARRWGKIPFGLSVPALLLLPGFPQISFYFNDNVVAAAFASAALANTAPAAGWRRYFGSGILLACAIDCRTDSALALALLGALACLGANGSYRAILARWLGLGAGLLIALAGLAALGGFNWLDVLGIIRIFGSLPVYNSNLALPTAVLYFGIFGWVMVVTGFLRTASRLSRQKRFMELSGLVIAPFAVFGLIVVTIGFSNRYGYPLLSPFFALYGGLGLRAVFAQWRMGRRWLAFAGAFSVILALAPAQASFVQDGPQLVWGGLWSPILWRQWQEPIRASGDRAEEWIKDRSQTPLSVVITTHFNDDAFLRERLIFSGYRQQLAEEVFPGCRGFFVFTQNGNKIVDIRIDDLYGLGVATLWPETKGRAAGELEAKLKMLPLETALSCPALDRSADAFLSVYRKYTETAVWDVFPDAVLSSFTSEQTLQFARLDAVDLPRIRDAARLLTADLRSRDGQAVTLDRLLYSHRSRFSP
jgi:hypothetical protein